MYGSPFNVDDGTAVLHEGLRRPGKAFIAGAVPGFSARNHAAINDQGQRDSPLNEKVLLMSLRARLTAPLLFLEVEKVSGSRVFFQR